jgi:uncharacterized protein
VRPAPRFVADAMLGSLARKLRILGFDTLYFKEGSDSALEALAKREGRVVLTSDKDLFRRARTRRVRAILVEGKTDGARLLSVSRQAGLQPGSLRGRASRCAICNGELEVMGRRDVAASEVPPKVLARHRLFFRCTSCSRLYWRGKHWERLRRLSSSLKTKDLT